MASLRRRGPRSARKWYVRFETGRAVDDKRPQTDRLLKGVINDFQAKQELARVERELAAGRDPFPGPAVVPAAVKPLLESWRDSLANRNAADDRSKVKKHLVPKFGGQTIDQIDLPLVMDWIDELGASGLSAQTQRHLLNLLSRFFSWAIERGQASFNPVKMVPQGKRPSPAQKAIGEWLEDDGKVPGLMKALGPVVGLMFYLANRSGMRLGEVCGLTMGDLEFLHEGVVLVGHSYGGPLKEDRRGLGKTKWVPAPADASEVLHLHLARRRLHGAKADDLVFPFAPAKPQNRRRTSGWTGYRKEYVEACWDDAAKACGVGLSWYAATRHSFVSRSLKNGASLDEVSAAVARFLWRLASRPRTGRWPSRSIPRSTDPLWRCSSNTESRAARTPW